VDKDLVKQREEETRAREVRLENLNAAYKHVMDDPQGRMVIMDIIGMSGMLANSASNAGFKTNETFYHEGKRFVGVVLTGRIKTLCPGSYIKMEQEALKRNSE